MVFLVAVFFSVILTIDSRPRVRVIETGQFHGDEIRARSGQTWLALFVNKRHSMLRYAKVSVRRVFDEITDYGEGRKTGKKVSVDGQVQPILLIRPVAALKVGPVTTLFHNQKIDFEHGLEKFPATFKLGQRWYVLKVVAAGKNPGCPSTSFPKNARLVLISGRSQQVLYTLDDCGNDPSWYVLWVGDLDRDGKLDLYVNVTQHYDVSERKLFLSSEAARGKLVREAGTFETWGC
jgi:hypothetical protein